MDNPGQPNILPVMASSSNIVIVGGGLNGPALALALAGAGHDVTLIDALPESVRKNAAFDGRAYALAAGSRRLLSAIDIWDRIAERAQPMLDIVVTDGHAGAGVSPFFMHFDHAEIEEGPMGHMVEDRHLRRAFLDAMSETAGIRRISGKKVVTQTGDPSGASVMLDDGTAISGALIIGCDGRTSGTAARAGIGRTGWDYGQTALVCAIAHERPHQGVAHQFFMPPGPLAILPLRENRCSIVWSERTDQARQIMAMDDDRFLEILRPRFGNFLGDIRLAGGRFSYPLDLTLANAFVADRIALVGDAAHGVHPIAGQGLNAGLRDVGALTEVLVLAARRGEDIGALPVLERYQQWRRFDTATLALGTDMFNRLFSNDNPILRMGRDLGMGLLGAMPGFRRALMREAAGLQGDLPALMRGRRI